MAGTLADPRGPLASPPPPIACARPGSTREPEACMRLLHLHAGAGRSPRPFAVVPALLAVVGLLGWQLAVAAPAQASAGDLDPGFGRGGRVVTDFARGAEEAFAVAVQADGKLVAAGRTGEGGGSALGDWALARYRTDGKLDHGFGKSGKVKLDFSGAGGDDQVNALAVQADGRLLAAGFAPNGWALARFRTDGTLDPSFGVGGKVASPFSGQIRALALTPDGQIVAAGFIGSDFALARYNADGTLDAAFGTGGVVTTGFGDLFAEAHAVAIQADGKIVAAGHTGTVAFALSGLPEVLHVTLGQPGRAVRRGGRQHLRGGALAEEGVHLADAPLDGQGRVVRQPCLERAPDPLDRVVVGAVARPVQHPHPRVGGQPPPDDLGVVDDDVVADHRDQRRGRVGGQQLLAEGGEAGADGLAGDPVAEAAALQVDRAEDGPAPVLPRGHDLLALPPGDPGRADPGQQVDVGLVLGQHHRTCGQATEVAVQVGEDLVAVGVALGDQAGSPPGGDLSDAAVQGPQGDGGAAQSLPQPWDGPGAWLLEEPQDALGEGGAAQPWSAGSGPVGQCAGAVALVAVNPAAHRPRVVAEQVGDLGRRPALLGEQDHEQAAGQAVGAVQQAQQVARVGGRAGRFGVHAGGTHTSGGLVGSLWSQAPTTGEATSSAIGLTAAPGLRAELLVSRLACTSVMRALAVTRRRCPSRAAWRRAEGRWRGIPAAVDSLNGYAQPLAGRAECLLDLLARGGFGEEEAPVLVTFRERLDDLAQRDRDRKARDPRDGCGVGPAVHGPEHARALHGQHQHAGAADQARGHHAAAQGIGQHQLFEAHPAWEAQGARAQATDRAGCQFEHRGPVTGVEPQLGMDRAVAEPERGGGVPGGPEGV